jgi:hypothetical protein
MSRRQSVSRPKTLAERLEWMAESLPGFREELDAVNAISHNAVAVARVKRTLHESQLSNPSCALALHQSL